MRHRLSFILPALILACGGESPTEPKDAYGDETLEQYLRALPDQERLSSDVPTAQDTPGALTQPGDAVLATQGVEFARAVNRPVRVLVATLRLITAFPPTRFDATEQKFVWGPWDNDNGIGKVALYVQKNPAGADFEYSYALLRSDQGDLAGATAVIAGGATPDPVDHFRGVGVALWDLEANHAFDVAHDPSGPRAGQGRGRFVTLFGHHTSADGDAAFNLAVFRDFVPDRKPGEAESEPLDVDYFYGRLIGSSGQRVDFVDSEVLADLCDAAPDTCFEHDAVADRAERFEYGAYFVNRGAGRAEAELSEGDLPGPVRVIECWDFGLDRTSFQVGTDASASMVETMENGSCAAPLDQSASALGLPTLDDVDPALLGALSCAAEHGLIGCD